MNMNFKSRLKEEMAFRNMQHKELAAKAKITQRALLTYVSSHPSMPPADAAVRIARALGVTVEYLVTGKQPKAVFALPRTQREMMESFSKLTKIEQKAVCALTQTLASATDAD